MRHSRNYDLWRVETKLESYVFWCNQCKILMLEASFCCKMLERDKLTHYLTDIRERETPFRQNDYLSCREGEGLVIIRQHSNSAGTRQTLTLQLHLYPLPLSRGPTLSLLLLNRPSPSYLY